MEVENRTMHIKQQTWFEMLIERLRSRLRHSFPSLRNLESIKHDRRLTTRNKAKGAQLADIQFSHFSPTVEHCDYLIGRLVILLSFNVWLCTVCLVLFAVLLGIIGKLCSVIKALS